MLDAKDDDPFTRREVSDMAEALCDNAPFLEDVGTKLIKNGPFMDALGQMLAAQVHETFGGQLQETQGSVRSQVNQHEINCTRASRVQTALDDHIRIDVQEKGTLQAKTQGLITHVKDIRSRIDFNAKAGELSMASHKQYHEKNEPYWGVITLIAKTVKKNLGLGLTMILLIMLLTGWGLTETVRWLLHLPPAAPVTIQAPNK